MASNKYFPRNHLSTRKFLKGKAKKDDGKHTSCFCTPEQPSLWWLNAKLRGSFSASMGLLSEASYTFSPFSTLNARHFSEISATAQIEKLNSSCKEICVLWDVYLVSSLWKSVLALPDLVFMWSWRRPPVQHAVLSRDRYAPSGPSPSPAAGSARWSRWLFTTLNGFLGWPKMERMVLI